MVKGRKLLVEVDFARNTEMEAFVPKVVKNVRDGLGCTQWQ